MPIDLSPRGITDAWNSGVRATNAERQQAAVNRSFLRSKQWVFWNRGTSRLEEVPRQRGRVRATIPKIGPDSWRVIAKLMRRPLAWEVNPEGPDDVSEHASRIAEWVLASYAQRQQWETLRTDHAYSTWEAGVAAIYVEWDGAAGRSAGTNPTTGEPMHEGEPRIGLATIHETVTVPGARDIERGLWWIHGQAMPPEEVMELYGLPKEPKGNSTAVDAIWRPGDDNSAADVPLTIVHTAYVRPHKRVPNGKVMTVVDGQVVAEGDWPFPFDDRLNIAVARVIPMNQSWLGHTLVTDAVPVQAMLNQAHSVIAEHMKQAGNARLWVPYGSIDDIDELTDEPGEIVEYQSINGMRPGYETPPAMPDWWQRQPDVLSAVLDDILSVHDVSRGNAPGGVESGVALSMLAEADDTPVGLFAKNLAECWGRVGSMVLQLCEKYAIEPRDAVVHMGKVPVPCQWTGKDLAGHTTATVPLDAVMPRSRMGQFQYALQLLDRGFIKTLNDFQRVSDAPDADDTLAAVDSDTAKAIRENLHMATGRPRVVDVIDDHANHMTHHKDFMRSAYFETLPDENKQMIGDHLQAHELYAAEQAAAETKAAMYAPTAAALPTSASKVLDARTVGDAAQVAAGVPGLVGPAAGDAGGMPAGPPPQEPPPQGPPPGPDVEQGEPPDPEQPEGEQP